MKKIILTICLDCGNKNDKKHKQGAFGVWKDTCDMCGKKYVFCASAPHDFGIYSSEKIKLDDKVQDLI